MYELRIDKQAIKYLKKLDSPNRKRLMSALSELAENPFADTSVTRMKGYTSTFRKRVGDFRIIYFVCSLRYTPSLLHSPQNQKTPFETGHRSHSFKEWLLFLFL